MIFKRFMTFGTLIALIFIPLFSSPVDAQTYFSDDFENPAESEDKWEVITGDWQVADGVYHQLSTADPWQASMVAAEQWSNEWEEYTIEFKVKPLTEGDAPVNVLFRVRDPVPQVWADRDAPNTYMYRWIINGWTNTESRPYMYGAGTRAMLAQTNNSLVVGNWHNIKLVVTKTGLAGYVDDVEMFDLEHAQWTDGRVGIQAYNGMMDFDDFIVYGPGGRKSFPVASGPTPRDGELIEATWVNMSWRPGDFAVSHNLYIGTDFDEVNNGAEGTFAGSTSSDFQVVGFPGFPIPEGLQPGTTYYWRIDEVNDTDPNSPWKGEVWSFAIAPKTAYEPNPADGAESVETDGEFNWTAGFGSKLHTVYFGENFDDVNNAAGGLPQGVATYTPPGPLKLAKTYYWRVDEFDAIDTFKGDVWSFTTEGAVGSPEPANGAVDVKQTTILTWSHGVYADSHQVYFGTDKDAVKNADTSSPEYKGSGNFDSESYDAGNLEWNTTYYWRIDEANNANPDSPWTGILWSFTTANFLVVDDFESYNDLDPADPESNRIFNVWLDGYDDPTNGSLVGYDTPPFAEQTIVHGGNQSMPLYYDNSVGNSEATLTLTYPRDWTENGVSTLSIWFRGNSDNAAETLYIALNGSAVVNHDNPNAAQIDTWTEWSIPLSAPGGFADQGVNLANVNTIVIGLGNKNPDVSGVAGGSGMMYFDDIRLYLPPEPAP